MGMRLEFGLAAQENTLAEVKTKLESKIAEYIEDINEEKDDFQKRYLLNRKGTWRWFLLYYVACLLNKVHLNASKIVEVILFQDIDSTIKHA